MNNESVGKKIVEALKKQAENMDMNEAADQSLFETPAKDDFMGSMPETSEDILFAETATETKPAGFFDDMEDEKETSFISEPQIQNTAMDIASDNFEMPSNIAVFKKLIAQLPSGVSRHTGAQIIKQTMEALGISMKSVLQDAQQVQEGLKTSARECQGTIQEYKKQILTLERQSQNYQKQYSALNDLISLFIQTTK
jgi:hypothetical protein